MSATDKNGANGTLAGRERNRNSNSNNYSSSNNYSGNYSSRDRNRKKHGRIKLHMFAAALLAFSLTLGGAGSGAAVYAISDAVLRASGSLPTAKTDNTVKAEKELEKLIAKEKQLKDQINGATINRSKLLSQKRSELKQARAKRDEVIKNEINGLKTKKEAQTAALNNLKKQLTAIKKTKITTAITAMEMSIALAQARLATISADLKKANDKLTQSYVSYKLAYDKLTNLDAELKKILDHNIKTDSLIKDQKAEYRHAKGEYDKCIKGKSFLEAERKMNTIVLIQTGINNNYEKILDIKQKVKSDYYQMIVNFKI